MIHLNLFAKVKLAVVVLVVSLLGIPTLASVGGSSKEAVKAKAEEVDLAKLLCNEQIQKMASREDVRSPIRLSRIPLSAEKFLRDKHKILDAYYEVEPQADEIDFSSKGKASLRRDLNFRGVFGKTEVRFNENDGPVKFAKEDAGGEISEGRVGRLSAWATKMAEYVLAPAKDKPKTVDNYRDPKDLYDAIADFENNQRAYLDRINGKHSFSRIINEQVDFDSVVVGGVSANKGGGGKVDAYLRGNQIVAYGLVEDEGEEVTITFKPGSCEIDKVVFFELPNGSQGRVGWISTLTPEFCLNLEEEISGLAQDLPGEDDPTEYKFRCREQGASDDCRCYPSGVRIKHWEATCHKVRQVPRVTAANRFEEFARQKKALPGPYWSRATYEKSRVHCNKVIKAYLPQAAQRTSGMRDNPSGVAQ